MKTGIGSRQDGQVIEGRDLRPCHSEYPTERIHDHIDELFASGKQLPEILEDVARLGAQLLMQAALEAEITEFLDRYPGDGSLRRCPARVAEWVPGGDGEDHGRAGAAGQAEAARHQRGGSVRPDGPADPVCLPVAVSAVVVGGGAGVCPG
jgi:hypothetical protein